MINYKLEVKYFQNTYSQKYDNEADVKHAIYCLSTGNRYILCNTTDNILLTIIKDFNTDNVDEHFIKLDNVKLTIERTNDGTDNYSIDALLARDS